MTGPGWSRALATAALLFVAACSTSPLRRTVRADWGQGRGPVELPLEVLASRHIYTEGKVAGRPTPILIDSGAGLSVLSRAFATAAGLKAEGRIAVSGAGGKTTGQVVSGLTFELGGMKLRGVVALVLDLRAIERRLGRKIPVIVGRGLFENAVVEIDYDSETLTCHPPDTFRYTGEGHAARLRTHGQGLKLVECQVEDLPPAWFQLDTGSGNTLDIFAAYTEKHDLLSKRTPQSKRLDGGVGGFAAAPVASLRTFRFADYPLGNMPTSFPNPKSGTFATRRFAGNLGAGVLSRFHVWIDFGRDQIHVEPGANIDAEFSRDRLGMHTTADGEELEVVYLSPGSPAEAAGLEKGTRLVGINEHRPKSAKALRDLLRSLARLPAGTELTLIDAAGEEHRVVLADYY